MTDMPAWARLKNELAEKIRSGLLRPGDRISPERRLADDTGLSVGTVRKALDALVREGLCYRARGRGTFVTAPPADTAVFFRMSSSLGADSSVDIIPMSVTRTEEIPSEEILSALDLAPETKCIRIRRVIYGRRIPAGEEKMPSPIFFLGVSDSFFSPVPCRRLNELSPEEFRTRSLYALLREECGYPMSVCDEWISIAPSFPQEYLGADEKAPKGPCLVMHMLSRTSEHMPLEYRSSWVAANGRGLLRRHQLY